MSYFRETSISLFEFVGTINEMNLMKDISFLLMCVAQDSQSPDSNRTWMQGTLEVSDFMMWHTINMVITYVNQDPSWWKLEHLMTRCYKIIQFHRPNAAKLELLEHMTIHNTANVCRLKKDTADWVLVNPPPPLIQTLRDGHGTISELQIVIAITVYQQVSGIKGSCKYQNKWKSYNNKLSTNQLPIS